MNKLHTMALVAMVALSAAGTQALAQTAAKGTTKGANAKVTDADVRQMIESSFTSKGPATVEGVLNQDATQKACSQYPDRSKVPAAVAKKVEAAELKQVKYPADNNWIGDWKE
ncbi:MAG: sulfur oxidation c-type cytochrome SoxX, partial [Pseudomonadota bacterium]